MPRHTPIYFKDSEFSKNTRHKLEVFMEKHPIATSTTKALMAMAILGGVLTISAAVPGLTRLAGNAKRSAKLDNYAKYKRLWARFNALKKRNLFEFKNESRDGGLVYQFTENGRTAAKKFLLDALEIQPSKKWDGKWHVVIFDIPEKYKKARYALYRKLKDMDFYQLQKSVWVHPFPCEAEINFLNDVFNIQPFVEVLIAENISNGKVTYYFKDLLKNYV